MGDGFRCQPTETAVSTNSLNTDSFTHGEAVNHTTVSSLTSSLLGALIELGGRLAPVEDGHRNALKTETHAELIAGTSESSETAEAALEANPDCSDAGTPFTEQIPIIALNAVKIPSIIKYEHGETNPESLGMASGLWQTPAGLQSLSLSICKDEPVDEVDDIIYSSVKKKVKKKNRLKGKTVTCLYYSLA